ncbi:wd-repeat protein interacting with phosphoinosides wipi -related [Anaeramoeba flamelloides]|uniref:Wd-repeat protein interacting with phosphoinosides wipi -related n=1 Tax=Anaeramoeba flamelloides TaxID=1746091 RepID=A0ABQ8YRW1_9EUKA|nr:wd-repeat protein interacting with phosphoinosides wipi -related [Anaeramoeba flamelloides]
MNERNCTRFFELNQQITYFTVLTDRTWYVYSVTPFQQKLKRISKGQLSVVSMLSSSNIYLFVGNDESGEYSQNNLYVWDDLQKGYVLVLKFKNRIQKASISHQKIFVIFEKKLEIYSITTLELVSEFLTFSNPLSVFCYCDDPKDHHLRTIVTLGPKKGTIGIKVEPFSVYTGRNSNNPQPSLEGGSSNGSSDQIKSRGTLKNRNNNSNTQGNERKHISLTGQKKLNKRFGKRSNTNTLIQNVKVCLTGNPFDTVINVDDAEIRTAVLSNCGRFVAVCSVKGTTIKVFSTLTGQLISEKKRGAKRGNICSLAFNRDCNFLVASSLRGTIHVFTLPDVQKAILKDNLVSLNLEKPLFASKSKRADCKGSVSKDHYSKVGFNHLNQIIVILDNGQFYKFQIDLNSSGLILLAKHHFLKLRGLDPQNLKENNNQQIKN